MREATGELNTTVIVVILVAAIVAFFFGTIWPNVIKKNIEDDSNCQDAYCKCASANCTTEESTGLIECTLRNGRTIECPFKG